MGYRIVRISEEIFGLLFREGNVRPDRDGYRLRITKGLPPGAKLEAISMDVYFMSGEVALKFSHPWWEETAPDERIPEAQVEFTAETTTEFRPWMFDKLTDAEKAELRAELDKVPTDAPHVVEGTK